MIPPFKSLVAHILIDHFHHRASHATTPRLPPPTPSSFPLDFSKLLQVTSVSPRARASSESDKAHKSKSSSSKTHRHRQRQAKIEEEEDGWDLIEGEDM